MRLLLPPAAAAEISYSRRGFTYLYYSKARTWSQVRADTLLYLQGGLGPISLAYVPPPFVPAIIHPAKQRLATNASNHRPRT